MRVTSCRFVIPSRNSDGSLAFPAFMIIDQPGHYIEWGFEVRY